jgi:hypothetical protein
MADLATLAQFKTYKDIDSDNTKEDDSITQMLAAASSYIKQYCGRDFNNDEEIIEYFDASDATKVFLSEYPIIDITSVEFSSDGGQNYTLGTLGTDYFVGEDYITSGTFNPLYDSTSFIHDAIKVTYTAGFEDLPADITQACMDLTEYFRKTEYNPKSSLGTNMVERSNKDGADITQLPAHIYRVLLNYRNVV